MSDGQTDDLYKSRKNHGKIGLVLYVGLGLGLMLGKPMLNINIDIGRIGSWHLRHVLMICHRECISQHLSRISLAKDRPMAFAVDATSSSPFDRHFFKAFDVPSDRNKKAKWITSSSSSSPLSPPAKIAKAVVATSFKAAREQVLLKG